MALKPAGLIIGFTGGFGGILNNMALKLAAKANLPKLRFGGILNNMALKLTHLRHNSQICFGGILNNMALKPAWS